MRSLCRCCLHGPFDLIWGGWWIVMWCMIGGWWCDVAHDWFSPQPKKVIKIPQIYRIKLWMMGSPYSLKKNRKTGYIYQFDEHRRRCHHLEDQSWRQPIHLECPIHVPLPMTWGVDSEMWLVENDVMWDVIVREWYREVEMIDVD